MQIRLALNLIRIYAVISAPFIPDTADAILKSLKISDKTWPTDLTTAVNKLVPGNLFVTPENLFNKISDEDRDLWALKFSGNDT
jgi:methionyl-tRNA synthetase